MTVAKVAVINRWIGLSTDTKPSSSVNAGDKFYETNTGNDYIYNGSAWVLFAGGGGGGAGPASDLQGLSYQGTCNSGMTGSTTSIVCAELAGYGNDFFNDHYWMQIITNANSIGAAPESEYKQITDYVSTTGTFTVDAFSANVEENDEILIIHESLREAMIIRGGPYSIGSVMSELRLVDPNGLIPAMQVPGSYAAFQRTGGYGSGLIDKEITFAGATPNAIGDFDGTGNPAGVFTVTGDVIVKIIPVCTTSLVFDANATIELGIGGGSEIIATTDLTVSALVAREIWHDATPDSEIEAISVMKEYIITDGNDIQLNCGVANTNTGAIKFYCFWVGLSSDGNVVAA